MPSKEVVTFWLDMGAPISLPSRIWLARSLRNGRTVGQVRRSTYGTVYGMERTTVYLTEAQKRALERAARATGRSEAELIREGVEVVTSRVRAAEPALPLFESGQPDLAEHIDEALAGFGDR
jgi:hypothetical protein